MPNLPIATGPPFEQTDQLNRESSADLATRCGTQDTESDWNDYLARDLKTNLLDELFPCMWLVARKEGSHLDSLHEHLIKKRTVVIAEDPKLHLVWYYDTVYVKPLPDYLLNYNVWKNYIPKNTAQQSMRYEKYHAAVGFIRSYSFLIQHESDFIIAQRFNLLPKHVSFQRFQKFIRPFRLLQDDDVSHRYQYGQLRLTRLNLMVRIVRIIQFCYPVWTEQPVPWNYQDQVWQTGHFFQVYVAPSIFAFTLFSLVLSSMQVVLAARGPETWETFVKISWGFSIAIIIFCTVPIVATPSVILVVLIVQGQFAIRMKWRSIRSGDVAK